MTLELQRALEAEADAINEAVAVGIATTMCGSNPHPELKKAIRQAELAAVSRVTAAVYAAAACGA